MEQWTGETATQSPLQPVQQADNDNSTIQYTYNATGDLKYGLSWSHFARPFSILLCVGRIKGLVTCNYCM